MARLKGVSGAGLEAKVRGWLDRVDLGDCYRKKCEELSKGMQQKVQFIAAILAEPQLLVLDEPFSGMDPVNQDLFKDLILELHRKGTTIVLSTHVMESAERLCKHIALIDRGRAVLNDSVAAIKQSFGKNSLLLEYDGDGSFLKDLPGVAGLDDYGRYVEVRLDPGAEPQRFLAAVVARLAVKRFEIVTPTLHNIFIQQVGSEKAHA